MRNSMEIKKTIEDNDSKVEQIDKTAEELTEDANKMKAALDSMLATGEYDDIISSLHNDVGKEVEVKKKTEIAEKIANVKTNVEQTAADNSDTISKLETNITKTNEIKNNIASNVEGFAQNARSDLEKGAEERKELNDQLEKTDENATEVGDKGQKIEV